MTHGHSVWGLTPPPASIPRAALKRQHWMLDLAKHGRLPWDANFGAEIAQAYKPSPDAYLRNAEARRGSSRNAFVSSRRIIMTWRRGVADFAPAQGEHGPDQTTDLTFSLPAENWDGCE